MEYPIRIGAQLWPNKDDTPEQIEVLVEKMHDCGIKLIRLMPYWDFVEKSDGVYDFACIDACFSAAERLDMGIAFTFKPVSPPSFMRKSSSFLDFVNLFDPELWESILRSVDAIVERYCDSKALDSWILWNEPRFAESVMENTGQIYYNYLPKHSGNAYRAFLRKRYNQDIDELNRHYFYQYNNFDEIEADVNQYNASHRGSAFPERVDLFRFAVDTVTEKLEGIKEVIRKRDTFHPVHTNNSTVTRNGVTAGSSIWKQGQLNDFLGCSFYHRSHSSHYMRNGDEGAYLNLCCDLMRSATCHPDMVYWITELQAGLSLFNSVPPASLDDKDIKLCLWQCIGAGAKAVVYWEFNPCWNGEWSLIGQALQPTKRSDATKQVAEILEENAALFAQTKPVKPEIYILNSETTFAHDVLAVRKNTEELNTGMHMDAMWGAYLMMTRWGYEVGFIDENRVMAGEYPKDAVIVAPTCTAIPHACVEALTRFVYGGGTLIADGLFAWKDEYACFSTENLQTISKMGVILHDIEIVGENTNLTDENGKEPFKPWFLKVYFEDSENTTHRFECREPGIVQSTYGKGTLVRIGTVLFQHYQFEPFDASAYLLPLLPPCKSSIRLMNISDTLHMRLLEGEQNVIVITNFGDHTEAHVNTDESVGMRDIVNNEFYHIKAGESLYLSMEARSVRVFATVVSGR